ncbi:hypothetical protein VSDG_03637 [Cytospora chrysosperma]|uniref:F-box domain-containing protein n=1 Tax=Cytospora chrysosperma TaxID=252740 RepID=A0A423W9Z0_CYTCH|nr:hypothetical protein VSDG_03637 [Valsa sordida]
MSSDSDADNVLTNGNNANIADTGTGISAFVPSSAENSAMENSAAMVKSNMEISDPENLTTRNYFADNFSITNSATENSTAESFAVDNSVTQTCTTVDLTPEEPNAEDSFMERILEPRSFEKLPPEIRNRILDYVFSDQPDPCSKEGQRPLTKTLDPPGIISASKVLRQTALLMYYRGREFCIQVPEHEDKRTEVEDLQFTLMRRYNIHPALYDQIMVWLEELADQVAGKVKHCIEGLGSMSSVHYRFVESVRVWSGRFRVNGVGFGYNWSPNSYIVGFKAFSGPPRCGQGRKEHKRINVNGDLDWRDFDLVRRVYTEKLRHIETDIDALNWQDVLLHPALQYIVKELCLLGAAGAPAMEWVEVMVEDWDCSWVREELGMPEYKDDRLDDYKKSFPEEEEEEEDEEDEEEEEEDEEDEEEEEEEEEDSEHESERESEKESEDDIKEGQSVFSPPDAGDESLD